MDAISTNSVKVPEPNISSGSAKSNETTKSESKEKPKKKAPARQYERPNIGVLEVGTISKTPLSDTFQRKKEEQPFTKYKLTPNSDNKKSLKLNSLVSLGVILTGIIALFKRK